MSITSKLEKSTKTANQGKLLKSEFTKTDLKIKLKLKMIGLKAFKKTLKGL